MFTKIDDLRRTSPEEQGVASSALLQFVEALDSQIHELHSFMLLRHGSVIAEGWWSPYSREYRHALFSVSKSFTATAVGLAVAEGRFSIDDPVLSFFPDEAPAEVSDFLAAMRVRHLLSMSTGHADDTWMYMIERPDGNWIKAFLGVPVHFEPGTHFLYNSGASYMLSAIIQKTTGLKLIDYLEPRLFEPLGITGATWEESPQQIASGATGLSVRTEDMARFGQLYLQKGMWQGKQLLPEAWAEEATTSQISNGNDPQNDWAQGYGYQFWRCRHGAYRGDGVFGQFCVVMPEQDAVLAITGGVDLFDMQQPLNLIWDILLPAMGTKGLEEDTTAHRRLTEKISGLTRLPVQGTAASPSSSRVSGQAYSVDANDLNIAMITPTFTDDDCTMRFRTAAGKETISCGYGVWQQGQTKLFNDPWVVDPMPFVASGAWTAEDSFMMVIRLNESPFYHTFVYHFADDEMIIETQVNVTFGSTKAVLLTAHAA